MIQITLRGATHRIPSSPGRTLLESARAAGVPLPRACTRAECGTCRVRVRGTGISDVGKAEAACLVQIEARPDDRLACQAMVTHPDADLLVSVFT